MAGQVNYADVRRLRKPIRFVYSETRSDYSPLVLFVAIRGLRRRFNCGRVSRMKISLLRWAPLICVFAAGIGTSRAYELFGVYRPVYIDPVTGVGRSSGGVVWNFVNSLAQDGQGRLFSVSQGQLVQIDPHALTLTPVLTLHGLGGFTGLAFSPAGELFGVQRGGNSDNDPLFRIDTLTGNVTVVGDTGAYRLQDLAFSPDGVLYAWSLSSGLITIDPQTGRGTDVNPGVDATAEVQALAFAPDGTLYGARDALFRIDPATGVTVQIGSGGYSDIRGLAVIPEPSTFYLLSLGLCGLLLHMCSRRKL